MQITMINTRRGTNDGFAVQVFSQDETYTVGDDISDMTARYFLRQGWAFNSTLDPLAEFVANRDAALVAADGNTGLTHFLNELSASATRMSKERIVQNPGTLITTGEL